MGPKNVFWLKFPRILRFFWDLTLTLLIIPKDAVFAEMLVFSNIFGFPAVSLAPECTKTVNFSCIPFVPKCKILKYFSETVFFLLQIVSGKVSSSQTIFGGVRAQKITKMGHFMDTEPTQNTLKIFDVTTTYAIVMKLTTDIYLNNGVHLVKSWGLSHRVYKVVNKKTLKMSQKINFFDHF